MKNYSVTLFPQGKPLAFAGVRGRDFVDALLRFSGRRSYRVLRCRIDYEGPRVVLSAVLGRPSDRVFVSISIVEDND